MSTSYTYLISTANGNFYMRAVPLNIISGLYYFKLLPGDVNGSSITNYGSVGGNATIVNSGSTTATIDTTTYPSTASPSSLLLGFPSTNYNLNGGASVNLPTTTWTDGSGFTIAFWYSVGTMSTTNQSNLAYIFPNTSGSYSNINMTHAGNIGIGGTFVYNGVTYNGWQGNAFYFNTYTNGGNTGATGTWLYAAVPFMNSNTWNHIALTISGTFSNPVYTYYFNGTPYVLGSSTFYRSNGSLPIGYPSGCLTGTVSFSMNMPGNLKNFYINNTALTGSEISKLMTAY